MSSKAELLEDFWQVLGLDPGASKTDVQRAYRKKSLAVHPDRYKGDNPEWATEEFLRLTRAKEVLEDDKARAAFEALQRARTAHREKQEAQDAGRRKLREDLEAREEAARKRQRTDASAMDSKAQQAREAHAQAQQEADARAELQKELERLRRSGRLGGQPQQQPDGSDAAGSSRSCGRDGGGSAATTTAGVADRTKLSLRWPSDAPISARMLTTLLVELGAPPDMSLAVVGSKAVVELPQAAAVAITARSVELAARGIRLHVAAASVGDGGVGGTDGGSGSGEGTAALPIGWREQRAPDGRKYYYHVATRQTQWTLPAADGSALDLSAGLKNAPAGVLGGAGTKASNLEELESVTMMRLRQASERQRLAQALAADEPQGDNDLNQPVVDGADAPQAV